MVELLNDSQFPSIGCHVNTYPPVNDHGLPSLLSEQSRDKTSFTEMNADNCLH